MRKQVIYDLDLDCDRTTREIYADPRFLSRHLLKMPRLWLIIITIWYDNYNIIHNSHSWLAFIMILSFITATVVDWIDLK